MLTIRTLQHYSPSPSLHPLSYSRSSLGTQTASYFGSCDHWELESEGESLFYQLSLSNTFSRSIHFLFSGWPACTVFPPRTFLLLHAPLSTSYIFVHTSKSYILHFLLKCWMHALYKNRGHIRVSVSVSHPLFWFSLFCYGTQISAFYDRAQIYSC